MEFCDQCYMEMELCPRCSEEPYCPDCDEYCFWCWMRANGNVADDDYEDCGEEE